MRKINNYMKNKKGLSPVVATVLLIAMVLVIALIIFLWFRGLTEEAITKFGGKNIKLVCDDVRFEADYSGNILSISNVGNVPIYELYIEISGQGNYITQNIKTLAGTWPETGINQGAAYSSGDLSGSVSASHEQLTIIPVLVGDSDKGEQKYACETRHGKVITL